MTRKRWDSTVGISTIIVLKITMKFDNIDMAVRYCLVLTIVLAAKWLLYESYNCCCLYH